jgi:hypothetical protein
MPLRRVLVIGSLDLVAAALLAVVAFRLFGASSGVDTNPPVCHNANGGIVSCSLTQAVVMLPTFAISLLVLVVWHTLCGRH